MSFFCAFIWCVIALSAVILTTKFYLPYYLKKLINNPPDIPDESEKKDGHQLLTFDKRIRIVVVVLVAVFAAVCGYFAFLNCSSYINLAKLSFGMLVLFIVVVTDLELSVIPNILVIGLLIGRVLLLIPELIVYGLEAFRLILSNLLVAILVIAFLFIMSKISKGGIGAGDIKLFAALAFLSGFNAVFFTLLISLFASALVSIILLIIKKKKLRDSFPMGPLICLGYGLTIIFSLA